jgi:hypothetical protein
VNGIHEVAGSIPASSTKSDKELRRPLISGQSPGDQAGDQSTDGHRTGAFGTLGPVRLKTFWVVDPDTAGGVERRFRALLGPAAEERFRMDQRRFDHDVIKEFDGLLASLG